MVAVVTAATCLVNKGSSCQKGCDEGGDSADVGAGGRGTVSTRPEERLR